jgi:hypothetical protein
LCIYLSITFNECNGDPLDVFVVDERDGMGQRDAGDMDVAVVSADTMMTSPGKSKALAEVVMREMV